MRGDQKRREEQRRPTKRGENYRETGRREENEPVSISHKFTYVEFMRKIQFFSLRSTLYFGVSSKAIDCFSSLRAAIVLVFSHSLEFVTK